MGRVIWTALFLGGALSCASIGRRDLSSDLQRPPDPLPKEMPRLSPLLVDATGSPVTTREGWARKRETLRRSWEEFLGVFPKEKAPLEAQVLAREDLPTFTREHVKYQIVKGVFTDGYLLTPKDPKGKRPAVVVFHPTVATHARQPAGVDSSNPDLMIGVHLVARGYVVLCPRCVIFDEGATYAENVAKALENHPAWKGMARMAYDGLRAVDYLQSLPQVNPERIGGIGHSLGAKEVLYAAAIDERYRAAVFSEGGIGTRFSNWDAIWYLGLEIWDPDADREHHQLLSLIAPRAFLLLAGESADNDQSWAFIQAVLPVYRLLGAERNIGWLNHRSGHRYPPAARAAAMEFLDHHLIESPLQNDRRRLPGLFTP